ncbi:MAG: diphthine--ammonia ligase [Thermoplasmata archaeon]|nr:MAG: diphthine--ammonia ligase [Thermoplasmata archaeon]
MRLGVLFSGGKDSCLALHRAAVTDQVVCLVTVVPENKESFFFHTPNLHLTGLQAEAMGIPLVTRSTPGVEEEEIADLAAAIEEAREVHGIEGIVTGAVGSVYQATRVQRVCDDLGLWCFNPLWQLDQVQLLWELVRGDHYAIISGVFAPPLDEEWLGRLIDAGTVHRLAALWESHGIHPAGEGGEIETTVLDAPLFRSRIDITSARRDFHRDSGVLVIEGTEVVPK